MSSTINLIALFSAQTINAKGHDSAYLIPVVVSLSIYRFNELKSELSESMLLDMTKQSPAEFAQINPQDLIKICTFPNADLVFNFPKIHDAFVTGSKHSCLPVKLLGILPFSHIKGVEFSAVHSLPLQDFKTFNKVDSIEPCVGGFVSFLKGEDTVSRIAQYIESGAVSIRHEGKDVSVCNIDPEKLPEGLNAGILTELENLWKLYYTSQLITYNVTIKRSPKYLTELIQHAQSQGVYHLTLTDKKVCELVEEITDIRKALSGYLSVKEDDVAFVKEKDGIFEFKDNTSPFFYHVTAKSDLFMAPKSLKVGDLNYDLLKGNIAKILNTRIPSPSELYTSCVGKYCVLTGNGHSGYEFIVNPEKFNNTLSAACFSFSYI